MDKSSQNKIRKIHLTSAYIPLSIFVLTCIYLLGLIDQIEIDETSSLVEVIIGFGYFFVGCILVFISSYLASLAVFLFWYFIGATQEEMVKGCYRAHKALNANNSYNRPMLSKLEQWSWNRTLNFINWVYRKRVNDDKSS